MARIRLATDGALRIDDISESDRSTLADAGAREVGGWLIDPERWAAWRELLVETVDARAKSGWAGSAAQPGCRRHLVGAPERRVVAALALDAGLSVAAGWISADRTELDDRTEQGLNLLQHRLAHSPFAAPERPELDAWGLGIRELAAAERLGRIVRLAPDVVLLPTGPALAMRTLAATASALHHQPGAAGPRHDPPGGDPAAGAP